MTNNSRANYQLILTMQKGIGLVELLISMLIGLFVMAGVVQMFATTTQNSVVVSGASRIQENIRYAFYRIREDVSQAGNLGCINASYAQNGYARHEPINNMLGLNKDPGEFYNFSGILYGVEAATGTTFPAGSVTTSTDTLNIRYVSHATRFEITSSSGRSATSVSIDKDHASYPTLEKNQIVVLSDCNNTDIFMITNDPTTSNGVLEFAKDEISTTINAGQFNTTAELTGTYFENTQNETSTSVGSSIAYVYAGTTGAYQYFIGNSAGAGGTCHAVDRPQNCSLFRRTNGVDQELAKGVHNMQIEYGWTSDAGELVFADATVVNNNDAWDQVDRIDITLSFNSVDNVITDGSSVSELLTRDIKQTFNLPNQL